MSCSYLYGIKKDYIGEDLYYYNNSWLYSPIIWDVLADKYIPELIETPFGFKKSMISNGNELLKPLNNKINDCDSFSDRVCWEMSQQQIFFTKDKKEIASAIRNFVTDNKRYYIDEDDNIGALEREHIIERFNEIANDIENLDEEEYPYFVFKNTSVDDSVESWFDKYDEEQDKYIPKSLKDCDTPLAEFVVIENDNIVNFILNTKFDY